MYKQLGGKNVPLDPADATLDENGFRMVPGGFAVPRLKVDGELVKVGQYPIWDTTIEELGTIGGAGA